jgi:undecaprenyl-phosphate galactose phosphotransferase/putative colanic acid biosynthesis UDP-glucose lipid carrier transferase
MSSGVESKADVLRASARSERIRFSIPFRFVEPFTFASDLIIILAASVASQSGYQWFLLNSTGQVELFVAIGALVCANFSALTSAQHNYRPTNLLNFGRQLRYVTLNWVFIFFILAVVAFSLKISSTFSRGSTISFFLFGWASLVGFRALLSRYLKDALAEGAFASQKVVLIAGPGSQYGSGSWQQLRQCGYDPIRTLELTDAETDHLESGQPANQKIKDLISLCQREGVNFVFLMFRWDRPVLIQNLARMLRELPIPVHLLPDANVSSFIRSRPADIGTAYTVELQRAPLTTTEQIVKRTFDIVLASVILVILLPLMMMTAVLIKLDSRGPVLFKQKRNGFNGRVFSIYKFRSMRVMEDGPSIRQATRNDPRITRIGAWLRQTSIDELPQLFNVLRGDMSLVGPRPHAVAHNSEYGSVVANYAFRHNVKPGITGWAQIHGLRGETQNLDSMQKRVEHDLWYIDHWTIWLDLRIVLTTMFVAYRQPTAY